jgi:hypothetical protein
MPGLGAGPETGRRRRSQYVISYSSVHPYIPVIKIKTEAKVHHSQPHTVNGTVPVNISITDQKDQLLDKWLKRSWTPSLRRNTHCTLC